MEEFVVLCAEKLVTVVASIDGLVVTINKATSSGGGGAGGGADVWAVVAAAAPAVFGACTSFGASKGGACAAPLPRAARATPAPRAPAAPRARAPPPRRGKGRAAGGRRARARSRPPRPSPPPSGAASRPLKFKLKRPGFVHDKGPKIREANPMLSQTDLDKLIEAEWVKYNASA